MTDDARDVDWPLAVAALPRGAAVIVRHREAKARGALATRLKRVCAARGILLLIANDQNLAMRVRADGVHIPQRHGAKIGAVKARGESTYDLERAITVQLAAKYVRDPRVSVEIAQYRPFYILGEVRSAGQYPYVNGMTVETAVAIAGGYSERANERKVQISRRVNGSVERMLVPPDTVVLPGDTIYVRERFF